MRLLLVLALAGCASVPEKAETRDVTVLDSTLGCLMQGKVLGAVRLDKKDEVIAQLCLTPHMKPEANS